jgi:hypothetical protein
VPTLPDHFSDLLSAIEPSEERLEDAKEIPAQVREFLRECDTILTAWPHSRLAGSYARHTTVKTIKDVDIILILNPDYEEEEPADVLATLFSALLGLPEALDDEGDVEAARRHQRRSVHVHLKHRDFRLDIVPALALDGLDKPLKIPDRDWNEWIETDPLGYGVALSTLNQANGCKVVPLIKLFKHWRDVQMVQRPPKSYWLESMVYHLFSDGTLSSDGKSYGELFKDLLSGVMSWFAGEWNEPDAVPIIADPMLGHNIAHNWERGAFEAFMRRVEESCGWTDRALRQENTDEGKVKAIEMWKKVFGDKWFPQEAAAEKAARLNRALSQGTLFVTSTGRVTTERPAERHVQPPQQRFYGE